MAATDDMSLLFKESVSIEKWFLKFSEALESCLTYLDLESDGCKLIYWAGKTIKIELKGDSFMNHSKDEFLTIMDVFTSTLQPMIGKNK